METRASFILVGLFTIAGILGGFAFFLWLASVQIDRQYAQYGVVFDNVSGLDQSADVLFNGVSVGRVTDIRIWERNPGKAYVAIEIDATTPVAIDTIAQLESQGVTGVAYIALAGGAPGSPLLTPEVGGPPIIPSRQSSFQSLVNSAPRLIEDAATIIAQLEELTGPENQGHLRSILENVDTATAGLEGAMTDVASVAETLRAASDQIAGFTAEFAGIGDATRETLAAAEQSFTAVEETFARADTALDALEPAIAEAQQTIADIGALVRDQGAPLADDLRNTLANADRALIRADDVMATDLGPALAGARTALDDLAGAAQTIAADVPGIMADLRAGVSEARAAIASASPGLRDFGRLGAEARAVVAALNDLIRRIAQDPSGFLLDDRVPEYRR